MTPRRACAARHGTSTRRVHKREADGPQRSQRARRAHHTADAHTEHAAAQSHVGSHGHEHGRTASMRMEMPDAGQERTPHLPQHTYSAHLFSQRSSHAVREAHNVLSQHSRKAIKGAFRIKRAARIKHAPSQHSREATIVSRDATRALRCVGVATNGCERTNRREGRRRRARARHNPTPSTRAPIAVPPRPRFATRTRSASTRARLARRRPRLPCERRRGGWPSVCAA